MTKKSEKKTDKYGRKDGWWRYHDHYNRDGYCDDPARGY